MKEVIFSGKSVSTGELIKGDLVRLPTDAGSWSEPPSQELTWFITNSGKLTHELVEVVPETVIHCVIDRNERLTVSMGGQRSGRTATLVSAEKDLDRNTVKLWLIHMIKAMKNSKNEQKFDSYSSMLREVESGLFDKE